MDVSFIKWWIVLSICLMWDLALYHLLEISWQVKLEIKRLGPHRPTDLIIIQEGKDKNRSFNQEWFKRKTWLTGARPKRCSTAFHVCSLEGKPSGQPSRDYIVSGGFVYWLLCKGCAPLCFYCCHVVVSWVLILWDLERDRKSVV